MAITAVNLVLCVVILGLGIWAYTKGKGEVPLYIGIAFGLFAVSHLLQLVGLGASLDILLIIIRLVAYVLVIYVLYRIVTKK